MIDFKRMDEAVDNLIAEAFDGRKTEAVRVAIIEVRAAVSDLDFQAEVDAVRPRAPRTVEQTEEFCRLVREGKVQE